MCTSPEMDRALVISSRNYDQRLWEWLEGDDAAPQDQLVNIFLGVYCTRTRCHTHMTPYWVV